MQRENEEKVIEVEHSQHCFVEKGQAKRHEKVAQTNEEGLLVQVIFNLVVERSDSAPEIIISFNVSVE